MIDNKTNGNWPYFKFIGNSMGPFKSSIQFERPVPSIRPASCCSSPRPAFARALLINLGPKALFNRIINRWSPKRIAESLQFPIVDSAQPLGVKYSGAVKYLAKFIHMLIVSQVRRCVYG